MKSILSKKTFIIAELGKNFIQTKARQSIPVYLRNVKRLVDAAKRAGADAVKFQTHWVEDEQLPIKAVSSHFRGTDRYQWVRRNTEAAPLEQFWRPLQRYCDQHGIMFLSTPMSRGAAQLLTVLDMPAWKIGSGDVLDFVLLDFVAQSGKPVILSSGMSTQAELKQAVSFLRKKNKQIILLHCVSQYPCPPEQLNLATIPFLKKQFKLPVGFSDHSLSTEAAVVAVALGAKVIEKHLTLKRTAFGADHRFSLLPSEFQEMVKQIRKLEQQPAQSKTILLQAAKRKMLGRPAKVLQVAEKQFRPLFRKTLVAGADLPVGTRLTADQLYAMRPQFASIGLPSQDYPRVVGRQLKRALKKYEPITALHLQ